MKSTLLRPKGGSDTETNFRYIDFLANQIDKISAKRRHSDIVHTRMEQSGVSGLACPCPLCKIELASPNSNTDEVFQAVQGAEEKSFTWLLQQLAEASEYKDILLPIPETVVFKKSRPAFLLQLTKDMFLRSNLVVDKIRKEDIIRNFTNIVRARKRDESSMTPLGKYGKSLNKSIPISDYTPTTAYGKEIAVIRNFTKGHDNEDLNLKPEDEEGPLRVTLESEFFEMMFERGGSAFWRSLVYIQTVVRSKVGLNEAIFLTFDSRQRVIKVEGSENRLMRKQPEEYCRLMMRRVADVLKEYANTELLRMECEFMKDDNGQIWLHYVRKIFVKPFPRIIVQPEEVERKEVKEPTNQAISSLIAGPDPDIQENPNISRIHSIMQGLFEDVKSKSGIEVVLKEKPKDVQTISAFAKLRPRCKYSFDEILNFGDKPLSQPRSRVSSAHGSRRMQSVRFRSTLNTSMARPKTASRTTSGWSYTPKLKLKHLKSSVRSLA
mmetsp:Transcript_19291/g.35458  ORF Transcript_19291/g.35458 Transcript_19291/m.35458 type:complete len:494 (-) Transcript_19291:35-1516(-)